jgi:hypothetical protein
LPISFVEDLPIRGVGKSPTVRGLPIIFIGEMPTDVVGKLPIRDVGEMPIESSLTLMIRSLCVGELPIRRYRVLFDIVVLRSLRHHAGGRREDVPRNLAFQELPVNIVRRMPMMDVR